MSVCMGVIRMYGCNQNVKLTSPDPVLAVTVPDAKPQTVQCLIRESLLRKITALHPLCLPVFAARHGTYIVIAASFNTFVSIY